MWILIFDPDPYETPKDRTGFQLMCATAQFILAIPVFIINTVAVCRLKKEQEEFENSQYQAKLSLQFLAGWVSYATPTIVNIYFFIAIAMNSSAFTMYYALL